VLLSDPTLFHPNFGGVPIAPERPYWGQPEQKLKLFSREIIFEAYSKFQFQISNLCDHCT